jgi:Ca-activated chloride channel family protein
MINKYSIIFITLISNSALAITWEDLWWRKDQQAYKELNAGNSQEAAQLFESRPWKAAALYRSGDYEKTADILNGLDSPVMHYNRGNALALTGDYDAAIEAYQIALEQDPSLNDAQYNLELIKKIKDQQNQSNSDQNQSDKDKNNKDQKSKDNQQNNPKNSQNSEQNSDNNNSQEQSEDQSQSGQQEKNHSSSNEEQSEASKTKEENQESQQRDSQSDAPEQSENQNSQKEHPQNSKEKNTSSNSKNKHSDKKEEASQEDKQSQMKNQQIEQQQATEQWLKRIPDDPGDLLRQKFLRDHQRYQSNQENFNE